MAARLLNGNLIARRLRKNVAAEVASRVEAGGRPPGLAVILVGHDPASEVYVRHKPALRPCTSKGVMILLEDTGVPILGLDATIVGASNHVGRPMGLELLLAGCTVTTVHRFSRDVRAHVEHADIVVSAEGRPGVIPGEWIRPGAIVIDVGLTRGADGKLHGDVQFEAACRKAGWITPVPGGVGPMTRVAMLQNTLQAARIRSAPHRHS